MSRNECPEMLRFAVPVVEAVEVVEVAAAVGPTSRTQFSIMFIINNTRRNNEVSKALTMLNHEKLRAPTRTCPQSRGGA